MKPLIAASVRAVLSFVLSAFSLISTIHFRRIASKIPVLLADGASDNKELEQHWINPPSRMFSVFQRRSHDYGTDNPINIGIRCIVLRMGGKAGRL